MTPQARAPGAARESAQAQLSPQSAASPGADCQSVGSHIAASLKLIAIVNPRDLRDANASTVALLEGECRPPRLPETPDDERRKTMQAPSERIKGGPGGALISHQEEKKLEARSQITKSPQTAASVLARGAKTLDFEGTRLSGII